MIANTSHKSGELKFTQTPRVLGYGKIKKASKNLPMWIRGNSPAHITAKIVIASAERLTLVRQCCRNKSNIAEMKVPACPIPTHQTKLVMLHPQPIVLFTFQRPIPFHTVSTIAIRPISAAVPAMVNPKNHSLFGLATIGLKTSSVIFVKLLLPLINGSRVEISDTVYFFNDTILF